MRGKLPRIFHVPHGCTAPHFTCIAWVGRSLALDGHLAEHCQCGDQRWRMGRAISLYHWAKERKMMICGLRISGLARPTPGRSLEAPLGPVGSRQVLRNPWGSCLHGAAEWMKNYREFMRRCNFHEIRGITTAAGTRESAPAASTPSSQAVDIDLVSGAPIRAEPWSKVER